MPPAAVRTPEQRIMCALACITHFPMIVLPLLVGDCRQHERISLERRMSDEDIRGLMHSARAKRHKASDLCVYLNQPYMLAVTASPEVMSIHDCVYVTLRRCAAPFRRRRRAPMRAQRSLCRHKD
jgi:hypothetical protein